MMEVKLTQDQVNILAYMRDKVRPGERQIVIENSIDVAIDGLEKSGLIKDVSDNLGWSVDFEITPEGLTAIAEYEASNARDDLARQMHDPATLDSADEMRTLLRTIPTRDELQLSIEEMRKINGAWAKDKARISELEAQLADAREVSRVKGEELAAAIAENEAYRAAIKSFADAVAIDTDLMKAKDGAGLFIRNSDGDRFVPIETGDDELHVRHLRALAEVYAKFERAGDE